MMEWIVPLRTNFKQRLEKVCPVQLNLRCIQCDIMLVRNTRYNSIVFILVSKYFREDFSFNRLLSNHWTTHQQITLRLKLTRNSYIQSSLNKLVWAKWREMELLPNCQCRHSDYKEHTHLEKTCEQQVLVKSTEWNWTGLQMNLHHVALHATKTLFFNKLRWCELLLHLSWSVIIPSTLGDMLSDIHLHQVALVLVRENLNLKDL